MNINIVRALVALVYTFNGVSMKDRFTVFIITFAALIAGIFLGGTVMKMMVVGQERIMVGKFAYTCKQIKE